MRIQKPFPPHQSPIAQDVNNLGLQQIQRNQIFTFDKRYLWSYLSQFAKLNWTGLASKSFDCCCLHRPAKSKQSNCFAPHLFSTIPSPTHPGFSRIAQPPQRLRCPFKFRLLRGPGSNLLSNSMVKVWWKYDVSYRTVYTIKPLRSACEVAFVDAPKNRDHHRSHEGGHNKSIFASLWTSSGMCLPG